MIQYYINWTSDRKGGKYDGETIVFNLHVGDISFYTNFTIGEGSASWMIV